jgi:hypothetical protein
MDNRMVTGSVLPEFSNKLAGVRRDEFHIE